MSETPTPVAIFRRLAAWVLPRRFHADHGERLVELFGDLHRVARREQGALAVAMLCGREYASLLWLAIREHAARRDRRPDPRKQVATKQTREGRGMALVRTFWSDVRHALRFLRLNPAFAAVSTLTLAVGIGTNAAVFSVVNGVLLRPLPYPESGRLVTVLTRFLPPSGIDQPRFAISAREAVEYASQSAAIEDIALYRPGSATIVEGEGDPELVRAEIVSANIFSLLGTPAQLGRPLVDDDGLPGASSVVVLGDGLWQRRFGRDPSIIGRSIGISGNRYEVVGVMPPDFALRDEREQLWVPANIDPADPGRRSNHSWLGLARLAPGASYEAAEAELHTIMAGWAEEYDHHRYHSLWISPFLEAFVGDVRPLLMALLGAVGFVLLIACVNVAGVLLARAEGRRGEISVRLALGGSRRRVARQLMTEASVMSVLGGALGIALAFAATHLLRVAHAGTIPRIENVGVDLKVLAFAAAATLATGVLFGTIPALQAMKGSVGEVLRGGAAKSGGRRHQRLRRVLIVAQIAIGVVLVMGAGLLIRSVRSLVHQDPGFAARQGLITTLVLPEGEYTNDQAVAFYEQLTGRVATLPSVVAASGLSTLPLSGSGSFRDFEIEGKSVPEGQQGFNARHVVAWRGVFAALGVPLIRGRAFAGVDRPAGPPVAVVDESFARKYFGDEDPIGKRLRWNRDERWVTVIGVVGDVRYDGLAEEPVPTYYYLQSQFPDRAINLVVRTDGDPLPVIPEVRAAVRALDPRLAISSMQTIADRIDEGVAPSRFAMLLLSLFAAEALVLGAVGVYGVTAYSVARRQYEFGIRMTLGATAGQVASTVLVESMAMAGAGILLGLAGALAATRVISRFLFEVSTTDPLTLATTVSVLAAVAMLATVIPVRRATAVDPVTALRSE